MRAAGRSHRRGSSTAAEPLWSPQEWATIGFSLSDEHPIHGAHVTAGPGAEPGYDMHFGLEMGIVLTGRMRRHWRTWRTDLGAGQVWFCGTWERHGWEVLTPSCRHLVLVLLPKVLLHARFEENPDLDWMAPFTASPRQRPQADGAQLGVVLSVVERFEEFLAPSAPERAIALELLTLELLLVLLTGWAPRSHRYRSWLELHYEAVNQAVGMALRADRSLTTAEAARACGMSPRAFTQAFEGLVGISFSKFALRSRLSCAAAQLGETDDAVSEVAARWGFPHSGHFQRVFREHYGVSPAAHRERAQAR